MAGIFIYSDRLGIAQEIIGFAKQAEKSAYVLTFNEDEAQKMTKYGADKVYLLKGNSDIVENYAKALAQFLVSKNAELFAVGATVRGRDLAARVAGYLDLGMISDISSAKYDNNKLISERMIYGGAVVQSNEIEGFGVVTIPSGIFETIDGSCDIETVELEADNRLSLVERTTIVKKGADLDRADKVVCIGMALEKKEDLEMISQLADVIGAEIGCTRGIAEERHWLPAEQYIGISGVMVKPQLHISIGISGQVQHVVGIRDSKIIVAIDNNEKAPIFRNADYGIVGDLYEVIPQLTEALKTL